MPISRKRWEEILEGQRVVHERAQTDQGTGYSTVVNPNIANKLRAAHAVSEEENIPTSAENRKKAERLFKYGSEAAKENYFDRLEEKSDKKFQKKMSEYEEKFSQYGDMSYDDALDQIKEDDAYTKAIQKNKRKADRYESMGGQNRDEYEAELNKETDAVFARRKADKEYAYSYTNQSRDDMQMEMENLQKQYDAETDENKKYAIQQQMNRATAYDESLMSANDVQTKIDEYQKIVDDYETKYPNGELQAKSTLVSDEDREAYKNAKKNLNHYKDLLNSATVNDWSDDVYALEPDYMQAFSIVYQYEKQRESDEKAGVESSNDPYRQNLDKQYETAYNYLKQKYTDAEIAEMSKKFTYVADRDIAYQTTQDIVDELADKTGFGEQLPYLVSLGLGTALDAYNAPFKLLDGILQSLTGEPINVYNSTYSIATLNNALQQGIVQQSKNEKMTSMALGIYCSLVQMGATMSVGALTGIDKISLFLMGSSAASQTLKDMAEKGASNDKIIASAIATGVAEALFEKVSLEGWLHPETFLLSARVQASLGETVKALLVQMGCEVSEEICTDIANEITDYIINGGNSNTAMTIEAYKNMGYTQAQAEKMYMMDFGEQLAETALSSMIISGVMSGSSVASTDMAIDNAVQTVQIMSMSDYATAERTFREYVLSGQSNADADTLIQAATLNSIEKIAPERAKIAQEFLNSYKATQGVTYVDKDGKEQTRKANTWSDEMLQSVAQLAAKSNASIKFAAFDENGALVDESGNVLFKNSNENGLYVVKDGKGYIYINPQAKPERAMSFIAGHELTHYMESTGEYNEYKNLVLEAMNTTVKFKDGESGNWLESARTNAHKTYDKLYKKQNKKITQAELDELVDNEIVADYTGNVISSYNNARGLANTVMHWQHGLPKLMDNIRAFFRNDSMQDRVNRQLVKTFNAEHKFDDAKGKRFSVNSNYLDADNLDESALKKIVDFANVYNVGWKVSEDGTKILNNKGVQVSEDTIKNIVQNYYNEEIDTTGLTDYTRKDSVTVGLKDSTIENLVSGSMFGTGVDSTSDYSRGYMTWMSPEDFLKLTTDSQELYDILKSESRPLDIEEISENENAREYDTIHLEIDKDGNVLSHQGRHRMIAFRDEGIERVPVVLWDYVHKNKPSIIPSMLLSGQNTSDPHIKSAYKVRIGESIPINGKHFEELKAEFGQSSSGMRFSIGENTVPTELDNQYMDAVNKGDMGTVQRIIDEESNDYLNSLLLPNDDDIEGFKFHKGSAPKHTMKRYAVFNVSEDGFKAAYAGNKVATPVGVWLDAVNLQSYVSDITQFDDGTFASYIIGDTGANAKQKFSEQKLAEYGIKPSSKLLLERGGKHSSDVPNFSQMNLRQDENGNKVTSPKDGALPHNKLIFEIEYGYDEDLTDYVKEHGRISNGRNQGLAKIYPNQYYDFKTNPNAVGNWGIGGTFRITRLVPYSEVVEKTAEYKANAVQEAKDMYANGEISKADMNKRIAGADAITLQKWVGGYHPEEFGLTVEGVDEMYRNGQKMKLTDAITRDDNGKIILPSQRFNADVADPRYSTGESTISEQDAIDWGAYSEDNIPVKFYHGSPNYFTEFDKNKARSTGLYGKGFYFTREPSHASSYGENNYEVYLQIKSPLKPNESTITQKQALKFLGEIAKSEDYDLYNYSRDNNPSEALKKTFKKDAFSFIQDISAGSIGDMVKAVELFNEVNGTSFDGIVTPTETVVFEPNQIKSTAETTFDDNGNPIPRTERFSARNDTRYSTGDSTISELKENQLQTILENNPANDDYHTWIRTVDDIQTFQEAFDEWEAEGYSQFTEDFTNEDMQKALSEGKITVYSSYPIKDGIFVSPSRLEAWGYSGTGKVYSKTVPIEDVAWIDVGQGQYAPQNTRYSIGESTIDVAQNNTNSGIISTEGNYGEEYNRNLTELGTQYGTPEEFDRLQSESRDLPKRELSLYRRGRKRVSEELRGRLSSVLGGRIQRAVHSGTDRSEVLNLGNYSGRSHIDGNTFHDVFEIARQYLKNGELVDLHEAETTDEHGIGYNECNCYLSNDGLSGFAITPDGDLISVFNLSTQRGFLRSIKDYVGENAWTLDCYLSPNEPLSGMYRKALGWKVAAVMSYNMEYDHDNIAKTHNKPPVVFMVNTSADVPVKFFSEDEYDAAVAYRNSFIDESDGLDKLADIIDYVNNNSKDFSDAAMLSDLDEGRKIMDGEAELLGAYANPSTGDIHWYHGTPAVFDTFDLSRGGQNYDGWSMWGTAIYLTSSEQSAIAWSHQGGYRRNLKIMPLYAFAQNMFDTTKPTPEVMASFMPKKWSAELKEICMEDGGEFLYNLAAEMKGKAFANMMMSFGYDGVVEQRENNQTDICVFDPKAVKSSRPFTYIEDEVTGEEKLIELKDRLNIYDSDNTLYSVGESTVGNPEYDYGEIGETFGRGRNRTRQTTQTPQQIQRDERVANTVLPKIGDVNILKKNDFVQNDLIQNDTNPKGTLRDRMMNIAERAKKDATYFKTHVLDAGSVLHDVSNKYNTNTYMTYINAKGSSSIADNIIGGYRETKDGTKFYGGMTDATGKVVGKSFAELQYPFQHASEEFLNEHNVEGKKLKDKQLKHWNECQEYLVMKLNLDEIRRTKRPRITGYDSGKSSEIIRNFEAKYGKAYANELSKMNKTITDYIKSFRLQTGVITEQDDEAWSQVHPNYVPTYRYNGTDAYDMPIDGSLFGDQRKRAKGGDKKLLPLDEAYAKQLKNAVRFGNRNIMLNNILSDAEAHNELGQHLNVLDYFDNVSDTTLKRILDLAAGDASKQIIAKATAKTVKDIVEDTTGMTFEELVAMHTGQTARQVIAETTGKPNIYVVFDKDGGATVVQVDNILNTAIKDVTNPMMEIEEHLRGWQKVNEWWRGLVTTNNPLFTVSNAFRDLGQALLMSESPTTYIKNYGRAWIEMIKNSAMYRQFEASGVMASSISGDTKNGKKMNWLEQAGEWVEMMPRFSAYLTAIEKYGNTYEGRLKAQYEAKDITTNFSQGGDWTKVLNRNGFNFLNANVQGLLQIGRKITDPLKNQSLSRNEKLQAVGGFFIRGLALGMTPYLLNAIAHKDDKDYEELSDSIKTQYILFKLSNGTFLRIPYGRALVISTTLANIAKNSIEGESVDVGESLKTIWDNVGVAKPSGLWTPVVDAYNNKTWYGGTLVNSTLAQRDAKDQYDESTDDVSKYLGGIFNVSPKKISYVLDQWSGFIGDFAMPIVTDKYKSDNPLDYLAAPFRSRFTTDPTTNNDLYDTYNDMFTEVKKKAATDGSYYGAEQYFYSQSKEMNSIWTQIHEVQRYKTLSQEEKDALQQKYMSYGSLDTYKVRQQIIRDMRKAINGIQRNTIENYDYIIDASSKYPITDDMTFSQKKTQTFKMNNDLFGSEYALQTYGGDTWDNAQLANTCGIDFESYAQYFANTVDLKADKDENGNTISGTLKKKKWEALSSMNLSEGQRAFLFAMEYKISQKTNYYDSKALQKALNDYINSLPLSTEEKKYLKDNLK